MKTSGMQADARRFALIAILGIFGCWFLAAQASANIYWANPEDSSIGRADNAGGKVDQELVGQLGVPLGIAVDAHHVYWTDPGGRGSEAAKRSAEPTSMAPAPSPSSSRPAANSSESPEVAGSSPVAAAPRSPGRSVASFSECSGVPWECGVRRDR